MKSLRLVGLFCCAAVMLSLAGCRGSTTGDNGGERYGNYTLKGTYYDDSKQEVAKSNAVTTLTQLQGQDNVCLVGLWAYNPPALLSAVKEKELLGKVKIVGFDENPITLKGIRDGHIHATVVQQPYLFGLEAIKSLYALACDPKAPNPSQVQDGSWWIKHEVVRQNNLDTFEKRLQTEKDAITQEMPAANNKVKVAFLTNNPDPFWNVVEAGAHAAAVEINKANPNKGVELMFRRPDGSAQDQSRILNSLKTQGVQAVAISVNDAKNQTSTIDALAAEMPVICVDNDAPQSKRRFYIGTDNVKAGNEAGRLVKEALPNGGTVAIFVGLAEAPNAKERRQGVLDELAGEKNAQGK